MGTCRSMRRRTAMTGRGETRAGRGGDRGGDRGVRVQRCERERADIGAGADSGASVGGYGGGRRGFFRGYHVGRVRRGDSRVHQRLRVGAVVSPDAGWSGVERGQGVVESRRRSERGVRESAGTVERQAFYVDRRGVVDAVARRRVVDAMRRRSTRARSCTPCRCTSPRRWRWRRT